jgi:hypothetical protein
LIKRSFGGSCADFDVIDLRLKNLLGATHVTKHRDRINN